MVTMRRLFISDIHGRVDALQRLLAAVRYAPQEDRLILLGDYVGAQGENVSCLRTIQGLCAGGHATALLGNHDLALCDRLGQGFGQSRPLPAVFSYVGELAAEIGRDHPDLEAFLCGLPLWYEDETFIAVHAGFNPDLADWRTSTREEFTTIREPFLSRLPRDPRTVIFGHTPCQRLHGFAGTYFGAGKVGIDGGAGHGQQLNCLVFDGQRLTAHAVPVRHGADPGA